jgi:hypothetical protein
MGRDHPIHDVAVVNRGGVVFLYKLVEQGLLWVMAFIGGVTKGVFWQL